MTRRQVEKLAEILGQLGVAAIIGSVGDMVIEGSRMSVDLVGVLLGFGLIVACHRLTARLGGPRI